MNIAASASQVRSCMHIHIYAFAQLLFNLESYILIPFHLFVSTRQPSHRQAAVLGFSLASASENRLTFRACRRRTDGLFVSV